MCAAAGNATEARTYEEEADQTCFDVHVLIMRDGQAVSCPAAMALRQLLLRAPRRRPPASAVAFGFHDPRHPMMYGGRLGCGHAPVVLLRASCTEVLAWVHADPMGPFADPEAEGPRASWAAWGFSEDPQESTWKADWHCLPPFAHIRGLFVPRHATTGMVRLAPPRVVAFLLAFQIVNKSCWSILADALSGLAAEWERSGDGRSDAAWLGKLIESVIQRHQFGIIEAQMHFRDVPYRTPSHKDGATSLLHLSLTLGGRRVLRLGLFDHGARSVGPPAVEGSAWQPGSWPPGCLHDIELGPGDVYLTSPFCFEHAVEYPACGRGDGAIALQCRFGFSGELGCRLNALRSDAMLKVATVVAEALRTTAAAAQLRLPTLSEVQAAAEQLRTEAMTLAPQRVSRSAD